MGRESQERRALSEPTETIESSRRRRKRSGSSNESVPLEMTSLIDIVFLLLIFFMTATKFHTEEGNLHGYLPRRAGLSSESHQASLEPLRIHIFRERTTPQTHIVLDFDNEAPLLAPTSGFEASRGVRVPDENFIESYLLRRKARYPGAGSMPVIIDFGERVPTKYVVEVLNICKRAMVDDVTFAAPEQPLD